MKREPRTNAQTSEPSASDQYQADVPEIESTMTVEEARDYMFLLDIERAPVADEETVLGLVTMRELEHAQAQGLDPALPVSVLFETSMPPAPWPHGRQPRTSSLEPQGRRSQTSSFRHRVGTLRITVAEIIEHAGAELAGLRRKLS